MQTGKVNATAVTEHYFVGGHIEWIIADYPAQALHDNSFNLKVTDASGAPLTGAAMKIRLEMMNMICGDMTFELTEEAPGEYAGEGVPLMPGTWKAVLELEYGDKTVVLERLLKAVH
jgi:uncharacterized GH25 family protein